jgi:methylmalonyl-CoA mutase N-terminal domain/subunit
MRTIQPKMDHWEKTALQKALAESPEREETFKTESGIPTKRLYTPLDLEGTDYTGEIGFPGDYPYTRGVYPTMYRGRLWTMRNYSGFGTAEDTNKRK